MRLLLALAALAATTSTTPPDTAAARLARLTAARTALTADLAALEAELASLRLAAAGLRQRAKSLPVGSVRSEYVRAQLAPLEARLASRRQSVESHKRHGVGLASLVAEAKLDVLLDEAVTAIDVALGEVPEPRAPPPTSRAARAEAALLAAATAERPPPDAAAAGATVTGLEARHRRIGASLAAASEALARAQALLPAPPPRRRLLADTDLLEADEAPGEDGAATPVPTAVPTVAPTAYPSAAPTTDAAPLPESAHELAVLVARLRGASADDDDAVGAEGHDQVAANPPIDPDAARGALRRARTRLAAASQGRAAVRAAAAAVDGAAHASSRAEAAGAAAHSREALEKRLAALATVLKAHRRSQEGNEAEWIAWVADEATRARAELSRLPGADDAAPEAAQDLLSDGALVPVARANNATAADTLEAALAAHELSVTQHLCAVRAAHRFRLTATERDLGARAAAAVDRALRHWRKTLRGRAEALVKADVQSTAAGRAAAAAADAKGALFDPVANCSAAGPAGATTPAGRAAFVFMHDLRRKKHLGTTKRVLTRRTYAAKNAEFRTAGALRFEVPLARRFFPDSSPPAPLLHPPQRRTSGWPTRPFPSSSSCPSSRASRAASCPPASKSCTACRWCRWTTRSPRTRSRPRTARCSRPTQTAAAGACSAGGVVCVRCAAARALTTFPQPPPPPSKAGVVQAERLADDRLRPRRVLGLGRSGRGRGRPAPRVRRAVLPAGHRGHVLAAQRRRARDPPRQAPVRAAGADRPAGRVLERGRVVRSGLRDDRRAGHVRGRGAAGVPGSVLLPQRHPGGGGGRGAGVHDGQVRVELECGVLRGAGAGAGGRGGRRRGGADRAQAVRGAPGDAAVRGGGGGGGGGGWGGLTRGKEPGPAPPRASRGGRARTARP